MPIPWLRHRLFRWGADYLTKPLGEHRGPTWHDPDILRQTLRPGDIVLVEGDQRVSEIIKFLTQSSWSHAAIYVGDALQNRSPEQRASLEGGVEADTAHMVIEALLEEGVTANPIAKYTDFNLRICRPLGLQAEDLAKIVSEISGQMGSRYNVRHVFDLARYFFPVSLIPRRFRRTALELGSDLTHEVICSTLIAQAFQNVGFPIRPTITPDGAAPPSPWYTRLVRRRTPYPARFRHKRTSLVTPRDFDLSPYFEIIKPNLVAAEAFDYRRIRWDDIRKESEPG